MTNEFKDIVINTINTIDGVEIDNRNTTHSYSENTMSERSISHSRLASYSEPMLKRLWPECDYEKYIFSYIDTEASIVHYFRKERLEPTEVPTDDLPTTDTSEQ